ncbi:MAG: AraC family transcriptional regulator [Bacteroidota bacterium]
MIKSKETILLFDQPLFTKVSMETPMRDTLPLPTGACYAYIVNGDGQKFSPSGDLSATPGQVILSLCNLTLGRMISDQPQGSVESIVVHLGQELLQQVYEGNKPQLWEELEKPVTRYVVQSAAGNLVTYYFEGIAQLFHNQAALTEELLALKLKEIVLLLLQTDNANARQIIRSLFSDRTFTFKEVVDAHICTPASIENLAMLTNCSVSTFKRKFSEIYQTTPGAYITNKRVERVADLLKVSDEAVSAIGYDCGFSSPEHLSRAFKKKYGVSPAKYRLNFTVKEKNF